MPKVELIVGNNEPWGPKCMVRYPGHYLASPKTMDTLVANHSSRLSLIGR